jgi:hypothetical protein
MGFMRKWAVNRLVRELLRAAEEFALWRTPVLVFADSVGFIELVRDGDPAPGPGWDLLVRVDETRLQDIVADVQGLARALIDA